METDNGETADDNDDAVPDAFERYRQQVKGEAPQHSQNVKRKCRQKYQDTQEVRRKEREKLWDTGIENKNIY